MMTVRLGVQDFEKK